MAKKKMGPKPGVVIEEFYSKGDAFECALVGALGKYSYKGIRKKLGLPLTDGQIRYRLKYAGISLRKIRDGESRFYHTDDAPALTEADHQLTAYLKKHM